jgi:hypothetical protein
MSRLRPSRDLLRRVRVEHPKALRPSQSGGTMEEQVEDSSFPIAGHWDSKLARRFVADDYNGVSVFIFNGADVGRVYQPLAMDAQELAAE